jgi:hypothetical protein
MDGTIWIFLAVTVALTARTAVVLRLRWVSAAKQEILVVQVGWDFGSV